MPTIALRQKPEIERAEFHKSLPDGKITSGPASATIARQKLPSDWAEPDGQGAVAAHELLMLVQ